MGAVAKFPLAVRLDASNFDFGQAKDGGADVRFAGSDGTPLPYAIEAWDKATQTAALWVKVDVRGNDATQSITMYFGKDDAGDASDSRAVFATSDGFLGVWHLDEEGSTTAGGYKDATGGGADATGVNLAPGASVDARVGKGQKTANAMEQWLRVDDDAKKFRPMQMTASIWGKADSFPGRSGPGGYDTVFSSGEGWTMQKFSLTKNFETCFNNDCAPGKMAINTGAWYHFVVVRQGGNQRFYVNGARYSAGTVAERADAKPLGIGNQTQYLMNAKEKRSWDGVLDEARVMSVACDDNWIKLDYESQREGSKLLAFGATVAR
jgi:hypothetical protein